MRITNSLLQREALASFQRNLREIAEANRQVSSGERIVRPSDDPIAAGAVLRGDNQLRALEQYRRNIGHARSRLSTEEHVLGSINDLITRAKELAVATAGDTSGSASRSAARAEVDQLLSTVVQLGNTRFQGSYLFGGNYADTPPFDATGATDPARPPVGERQTETGAGQTIATNHDGQSVFVDSQVIAALQELSTALGNDDGAAITASITTLDSALSATQDLIGEVGARGNALDVAEANAEAWDVHLRTYRSDLTDVELEEAVSRLINRQTAFQAALMANSRILQTSLTDYL